MLGVLQGQTMVKERSVLDLKRAYYVDKVIRSIVGIYSGRPVLPVVGTGLKTKSSESERRFLASRNRISPPLFQCSVPLGN